MKSKLFRSIFILTVLTAALFLTAGTAISGTAQNAGTVLSVIGEAFIRQSPESSWAAIKKGDQLTEGHTVKTGAKSLIRILSPDGTMIKVAEENETVIAFDQKQETKTEEGNISTFVAEFFSPNQRTRINAVRSLADPLQQDWIAFCNFDRLSPDKIEMGLELSAAYQNENMSNRSNFILWKLHDLFPDNPGLSRLSSRSVGEHPNSGKWDISGIIKGKTVSVEKSASVHSGDVVTVRYRSPKESYVYLFLSSKNPDGTVRTEQIYPKTADVKALTDDLNFSARIAAEEPLFAKEDKVSVTKDPTPFSDEVVNLKKGQIVEVLEEQGRRYYVKLDNDIRGWVLKHKLTSENLPTGTKSGDPLLVMTADETTGQDYIWGWSSPGPLPHHHIYNAVSEAERILATADDGPDEAFLQKTLPVICGAFAAVKLNRR